VLVFNRKSHISSVKKWLSTISDLSGNFKDLLEHRMNEAAESEKILESMRVSSYSDAFKKLYKMVGKEIRRKLVLSKIYKLRGSRCLGNETN
jgi:hypothetical protein